MELLLRQGIYSKVLIIFLLILQPLRERHPRSVLDDFSVPRVTVRSLLCSTVAFFLMPGSIFGVNFPVYFFGL